MMADLSMDYTTMKQFGFIILGIRLYNFWPLRGIYSYQHHFGIGYLLVILIFFAFYAVVLWHWIDLYYYYRMFILFSIVR